MTDVADWAGSILEIAYEEKLDIETRAELIGVIEAYIAEAVRSGIDAENAKLSLRNEILDIAPVIEPFPRVLKRVLRNQKST